MALLSTAILRGLLSARPTDNTTLTTGRLYYATDTSTWYRDNGATWDSQPAAAAAHASSHQVGGADAFTGIVPGSAFAPGGLTGATAATRYVGGTASAAPTSGTFAVGDFVITQAGSLYICTTAGSPGTWTAVSGGGGSGATTKIAETILASDTASIAFSSIASTYRALRVVLTGRSAATGVTDSLLLRCNGDTAANYDSQKMQGNGSTLTAVETIGATAFTMTILAAAGATASYASTITMELNDYARTAWMKPITVIGNEYASGTTGYIVLTQIGGGWRSTAAITSLTLLAAGGNLKAGTVAALYGIS